MDTVDVEHDVTLWMVNDIPARMVYAGRRWQITDTPTRLRHSVQQDTLTHRGLAGDPLFKARRTLHNGASFLTDKQHARLGAVVAAAEHVEVEATWGRYQRIVATYGESHERLKDRRVKFGRRRKRKPSGTSSSSADWPAGADRWRSWTTESMSNSRARQPEGATPEPPVPPTPHHAKGYAVHQLPSLEATDL